MKYPRLISVNTDEDYFLYLKYDNGESKKYAFAQNLTHPFYEPLKNYCLFLKFLLSTESWNGKRGRIFVRSPCMKTAYPASQEHRRADVKLDVWGNLTVRTNR